MNIIKSLAFAIIDFFYPPLCIVCNSDRILRSQKVCAQCWDSIPRVTQNMPQYRELCEIIVRKKSAHEFISCFLFTRNGAFRHIIHALKYRKFKSIGIQLGRIIGTALLDRHTEFDIIIPVPLHRVKRWERGYNQSDLIAQGISSLLQKPIAAECLLRTRNTASQTTLSIEDRRQNMQNAFIIRPKHEHDVKAKICLLVDDIITTGATVKACIAVLRKAGAAQIIVVSSAIAE
jgi:ComF family protein